MSKKMSKEEKVFLEKLIEEKRKFSQREEKLKNKEKCVEDKLLSLKAGLLRWFGSSIHRLLEQKDFAKVSVGFVFGLKESEGTDPAYCRYRIFQVVNKSIFPINGEDRCLWLRIEFKDPRLMPEGYFRFSKIILLRELSEDSINSTELLAKINNLSSDLSLFMELLKHRKI